MEIGFIFFRMPRILNLGFPSSRKVVRFFFLFPAYLFQYGSDDHAEFLCVVSREVASNATDENGPQHTDKAKVNKS